MTEDEILERFTELVRELLLDESVNLDRDTVLGDLPGFDSMIYVLFIATAESKLDIKYRVADIEAFERVGDVVDETLALLQRRDGG